MLKAQEALGDCVRNHSANGITIWHDALSVGPRFYLERWDHQSLEASYFNYSKWENWVLRLEAKIRATIGHPEPWVAQLRRLFDLDGPLRLMLRFDTLQSCVVDLSVREPYISDGIATEELRRLMAVANESPTWDQVRQSHLNAIRTFETALREQLDQLWIAGEPENPQLEAACMKLSKLRYVDAASVKTRVVMAEQLFRTAKWKPAAATMRLVLEQIIQDAYAALCTRTADLNAGNLHDKTRALGQHAMISNEIGRFAYGTYALLSEVGSHTGDIQKANGEHSWHAARVAISLLAGRLA